MKAYSLLPSMVNRKKVNVTVVECIQPDIWLCDEKQTWLPHHAPR